jgi:hypothetical protein
MKKTTIATETPEISPAGNAILDDVTRLCTEAIARDAHRSSPDYILNRGKAGKAEDLAGLSLPLQFVLALHRILSSVKGNFSREEAQVLANNMAGIVTYQQVPGVHNVPTIFCDFDADQIKQAIDEAEDALINFADSYDYATHAGHC